VDNLWVKRLSGSQTCLPAGRDRKENYFLKTAYFSKTLKSKSKTAKNKEKGLNIDITRPKH